MTSFFIRVGIQNSQSFCQQKGFKNLEKWQATKAECIKASLHVNIKLGKFPKYRKCTKYRTWASLNKSKPTDFITVFVLIQFVLNPL